MSNKGLTIRPTMNGEREFKLPVYIKRKIRMLKDEFCLKLTDREIEHFRALKTHADVDAYAHQLLEEKL